MEIVSQIISGAQGEIILREKSTQPVELGEILIAEDDENKILLQVFDLEYGSQLDPKRIELASGLNIEENWNDLKFYDPELRNYVLAKAKALAQMKKNSGITMVPKRLPKHFSMVRRFSGEDKDFITKAENALFLGNLRSGSKDLGIQVHINGLEALSHHMLIAATTGRGKSNFLKVMLWDVLDKDYCGILVLDPHDEYYAPLEKHPAGHGNLFYYTNKKGIAGSYSLRIGVKTIKPNDVTGVINFTEPQEQAITKYWKEFGEDWMIEMVKDKQGIFEKDGVNTGSLMVVQRKIHTQLGLQLKDGTVVCDNDIFDIHSGEKTIDDICRFLSKGKKVVIDTSMLMDEAELLVGSIIANRILEIHKMKKADNMLEESPVVSILIEEAPRVLAEDKISNNNIYATIAREGRKFKVGLIAVTQLSSVIPREIMANMNTKIIFGNELAVEREAIISSASQDLSKDGKNIASLNKGEAIISSIFTNFAIPVKIPLIGELIKSVPTSPAVQRRIM